jgi:hypothetical protein
MRIIARALVMIVVFVIVGFAAGQLVTCMFDGVVLQSLAAIVIGGASGTIIGNCQRRR